MGAAIRHRGPDDAGEWISSDGRTGFAHRRLSIIDLSAFGHQPMIDPAGSPVIVFNGEIYNYRELRSQLVAEGHTFAGQSDTEVLLVLYRTRGEAMVQLLNGIFAFAVFDRASGTLFIACDAMGVKPLYFAARRGPFQFASELKALAASPWFEGTLNSAAIFRYLGFLWCPGGQTPFNEVDRLGPGEALRVKDGRIVERWRWADIPFSSLQADIGEAEAIQLVQEGVRRAVRRQLVADVPVGAFLSGGMDSSAVVAMAQEAMRGIHCFTIDTGSVGEDGLGRDLPYARRVAQHLGVPLDVIQVQSSQMAADLEQMVFHLDEPLGDPAALNVLYISQLARSHGVRVLLSGVGGDDLFGGYRRHRAVMLERYWGWLPIALRRFLRRASSRLDQSGVLRRRLTKAFSHAESSAAERLVGYYLWSDPARMLALFAPEHRRSLATTALTAPMDEYLASLPRRLSPLDRMLALEQRFFLADHNLLYTDKMSMAAGVEVRVPLLDNDLVKLANALPSRFKQRGAEGKWVLKKAMEPYLPRDVIWRSKSGFGAPVRYWLRNELREWVEDTLSAATLRRRGLFDPNAVGILIAEDRAGRVDAAYTILSLACIEVWCRQFIDNAGRTSKTIG